MNRQKISVPNYEQLYQAMNNRRGIELTLLTQIATEITGLICTFKDTDRIVAECAEAPVEIKITPPLSLDQYVHAFLWKLNSHYHLKRYKDTWTTLKIMVTDEESLQTMTDIYARVAGERHCTLESVERSIRSYRKAAEVSSTDYYRENLMAFSETNASFCWNALRLLKLDLRKPLPVSASLLPF